VTTLQRGAFTIILSAVLAAGGFAAYKWSQTRARKLAQADTSLSSAAQVLSVPPFSTKEPERYQATRIITIDGADSTVPNVTTIRIARDGDRRREDYESETELQTSYIETPAVTFILLSAKKLYAAVDSASARAGPVDQTEDNGVDFSPERLLNESNAVARYEKLGTESVAGQITTKYRVTSGTATNGTEAGTVTLIWIDETLGMPIRSEAVSAVGERHSKLTVELRNIKLQLDPNIFELPQDYKKVEYSELSKQLKEIRAAAKQ